MSFAPRFQIGFCLLATPLAILPNGAMAQTTAQAPGDETAIRVVPELFRADVAGSRTEPGFTPEPMRSGSLTVTIGGSVATAFDSNVRRRDNASGDGVGLVTSRAKVRSASDQRVFELDGMLHLRRFLTKGEEDSTAFAVRGLADVALGSNVSVFANGGYRRDVEQRSMSGTLQTADEAAEFNLADVEVGAQFAFGRLWMRPSIDAALTEFSPLVVAGIDTNQSFRNNWDVGGKFAVGYDLTSTLAAFAEARVANSESSDEVVGAERNLDEKTAMVGLRGQITPLIYAEIAAGYREANFDLARFSDFEGLTYRADVQWYITSLMTFRLEANQSLLSGGTTQVAAIRSDKVRLTGYFDPLRELRFSVSIEYAQNNFRETGTRSRQVTNRLTAEYRLNRNLSVGGFVGADRQEVDGPLVVPSYLSISGGIGINFTP